MCCSVLKCVEVCCSVLQCVAMCYNVSKCVAVCCNVEYTTLFEKGHSEFTTLFEQWYSTLFEKLQQLAHSLNGYRMAKTHRIPYLYRSFSAKEPYI